MSWVVGFFCVAFVFLRVVSQAQNLTCDLNDWSSLRTFAEQLESGVDGWDFNSSSPIPNCCTWFGITCSFSSSSNSSRVVRLELGSTRLFGYLSESLGNLDQLVALNLSQNSLQGSIPISILHLTNLEILDLSRNFVSGWFPSSINLPSIRVFNVSGNRITGSVPVGICINSTKVSVLHLADNRFSGLLPPGIGNCTSLEEFHIETNLISGRLPDDLFQLLNLKKLFLQENHFSGELSGLIGNLINLVHLDLSSNEFSGYIPDVFERLVQLRYFSAQSNSLTGTIPTSLANSPSISSLTLRNNSLNGTININCSAMVNLASLNLATNQFHGDIPENLPQCPRLRTINFARINFSGQVPQSFKSFHSLSSFSLSNSSISNLTGALETLQHCQNLTTLVLTLNFRGEEMPSYHGLHFHNLKILVIANCRLIGHIPQWLNESRNLQLLDLSWNQLDGSIPPWFGNLSSLFYLDLSNNSLSGEIPRELTEMHNLIYGNVSMEEPSPDFPLFVRRNLSSFKYRRAMSFPPTLELGNNFLTGQIWPEFGNLRELHVLELQSNNLSGPIPSNLSQMRSLETLDLSFNNLSGSIPPSLNLLTFLSEFSVAHNALSGPIPMGGQFSTFPNSSFDGNPGLYVDHGFNFSPNSNRFPFVTVGGSRTPKHIVIVTGVGIGVGSILVLALISVIIMRSCTLVSKPDAGDDNDTDLEHLSSVAVLYQDKDSASEMFFHDLLNATNNFDQSNIIGCGGFGFVYKAILSDGRKVAIKRLCGEHFQLEREFQAELETLSRAQHPNLVRLQGYCKYKDDRLLIYTYMENGSLDYWLHEKVDGPASLDLKMRLQIAQGASRALAHLHLSCEPHIIHRDIKSSNILLNEKFEAHVADFGLARLIRPYDTHVTTDLAGTLGYIPPEYGQASVATYKGDIYSFGVVLLELLTGKRPMDICRPKGSRNLIEWVARMRKERRETEVFDPFIFGKEDADEMIKVLDFACLCLSENPKQRPSVDQLVLWLEKVDSASMFPQNQINCADGKD